jgi:hypothetical protein
MVDAVMLTSLLWMLWLDFILEFYMRATSAKLAVRYLV